MTRTIQQIGFTAFLGLAIGGCATRPAPAPVRAPATSAITPVAAALAPAAYMQLAASSALFAVRASELVAERSSDPHVQSVARTIAQDQRGVGAQLNMAGRRLNLLPSARLNEAQAADLERLVNSPDVEGLYRELVAPVLSRSLQAHSAFAARGSSPTLRPVARMAAPATRRNLQQLNSR